MKSVLRFLGMLLLLGLSACVEVCGNDILTETRAPDGRFKVVVFQRDCGATTRFSTAAGAIMRGRW